MNPVPLQLVTIDLYLMAVETDRDRLTVEELAGRFRAEMIPLSKTFSYFCVMPVAEEDLKQYLHEPISALPPAACECLPKIGIFLVPFLEKQNGKGGDSVTFEKPSENRQIVASRTFAENTSTLVFAIKEEEMSDYHYCFYNAIAGLLAQSCSTDAQESFFRVLREELNSEVHGEVDERSWRMKQALLRRQTNVRRQSKLFREYALQSLEDTLTLYLHGICCDIDVETGPRQMASRYLRKRLEVLSALFPPPEGYAVLPEQVSKR